MYAENISARRCMKLSPISSGVGLQVGGSKETHFSVERYAILHYWKCSLCLRITFSNQRKINYFECLDIHHLC